MIVIVIVVYSILFLYQGIPLYKQKYWRDFWVNAAISSLSFLLVILLCFDIRLPSPAQPIKGVITVLFGK